MSNLNLSIITYFGIFVFTAFIYAADHLHDANKVSAQTGTGSQRRKLTRSQFRTLKAYSLLTGTLAVFFGIIIIPELTLRTVLLLSAIAALVILHTILARSRDYYSKEIVISVLYTSGIWVIPIGESGSINVLILPFLTAALTNLLLFAVLDYEDDRTMNFPGLGALLSKRALKKIFYGTVCLGLLLLPWPESILYPENNFQKGDWITILLLGQLMIIPAFLMKCRRLPRELSRFLSDLIFSAFFLI